MTYETPIGANMFAYCLNNPVACIDPDGDVAETVFDVISLGFSIAEVAANPYDPAAWASLVGDTIDLVPFVTGVGETVRGLRFVDKAGGNIIEIATATDFYHDVSQSFKKLNYVDGFTKSSATTGTKIHKEYKRHLKGQGKEHVVGKYRIDCVDGDTIYELKPFNPKAARAGVRQLEKYNNALGGGFIMRLEFY